MATSSPRWRTQWSTTSGPYASATTSCGPTSRGSRRRSRRAPSGRAASPPTRWSTSAHGWGSDRSTHYPERRMPVAALDLDLQVFQGPFDLLLTLILREEVDLPE